MLVFLTRMCVSKAVSDSEGVINKFEQAKSVNK